MNKDENKDRLFEACRKGDIESVKKLTKSSIFSKAIEIDIQGEGGVTPLMIAVSNNNKDVVQYLIDKGANVNAKTIRDQNSVLLLAFEYKASREIIRLLLNNDAEVNISDSNGQTPLMKAVVNEDEYIITDLLDRGADINASNASYNALILAAYKGDLSLIKLLVEHGADVRRKIDKVTPLSAAVIGNTTDMKVFSFLIENGAEVEQSHANILSVPAAKIGYFKIFTLLSENNIDFSKIKDTDNHSLLWVAANACHSRSQDIDGAFNIVKLLLEKGVEANEEGGYLALERAVEYKRKDIVSLLLIKGLDIRRKSVDFEDTFPPDCGKFLCDAIEEGFTDIAQLLIHNGANVNYCNEIIDSEKTPLLLSILKDDLDLVKLLIEHGADINAKHDEYTSLSYAKELNRKKIAEYLILKGAKT